jgi:cell division protein FtsZ
MDVDLSGATKALVHVTGGTNLTIEESTRIGEGVTNGLAENANVIFGARLEPEMRDQIRVISIVTGVKSKIRSPTSAPSDNVIKRPSTLTLRGEDEENLIANELSGF